jgi:hypothetical protein
VKPEEELSAHKAKAAFFMGVGRARGLHCGDEYSLPLFPLVLIMQAEGLLARDASRILERA